MSAAKSRVYFSPNVDRDSRESFCDILGFNSTLSLGKYLGIPIKQPSSSPQDFNYILYRVKNKLAGWKANLLSLTGRAVLIQVSLTAIPAYVMQCTYIPNSILEGVDRVNINFLWGSMELSKKIHWVGWQKVTKSKEEGSLGLQFAKGRNTALLAKLNWRFNVEKEALWARVLRKKYCSQRMINSANADKLQCSQIWKAIKKRRGIFNEGSMWTIGRDSNLRFW